LFPFDSVNQLLLAVVLAWEHFLAEVDALLGPAQ